MADSGSAKTRQNGLQHAASIIFALVAVVPLLIFAFTLHSLGAIHRIQAQASLALAVTISLLGYWIFRSMLSGMTEVVQGLVVAAEHANRSRRASSSASGTAAATEGAGAAPPASNGDHDRAVPGVGTIREIAEVARTMNALWQREAANHMGRRVQVSVANSRDPLVGTVVEVSDDGLILERPDGPIAVGYRRVVAIDRVAGH
jgi:hypothetical protein